MPCLPWQVTRERRKQLIPPIFPQSWKAKRGQFATDDEVEAAFRRFDR